MTAVCLSDMVTAMNLTVMLVEKVSDGLYERECGSVTVTVTVTVRV